MVVVRVMGAGHVDGPTVIVAMVASLVSVPMGWWVKKGMGGEKRNWEGGWLDVPVCCVPVLGAAELEPDAEPDPGGWVGIVVIELPDGGVSGV